MKQPRFRFTRPLGPLSCLACPVQLVVVQGEQGSNLALSFRAILGVCSVTSSQNFTAATSCMAASLTILLTNAKVVGSNSL
jgi:hypothetical protein